MKKINLITDSLHGSIRTSELEKSIISMPVYNRLHSILQNSTVYLTFPSNRTSRFEHSIGTMHLSGKMFYYGICNAKRSDQNEFLNQAYRFFCKWIKALLRQPEFRRSSLSQLFNERFNVEQEQLIAKLQGVGADDPIFDEFTSSEISPRLLFAYKVVLQAVRIVALLHDLGHPPFSHVVESVLKNIWDDVRQNHDSTPGRRLLFEIFNDYPNIELHEAIGSELVRIIAGELENIALQSASCDRFVFIYLIQKTVMAILFERLSGQEDGTERDPFFVCLHKLVSGTVDGDRLDYASRDPKNSGLNSGIVNYDRLLSTMSLVKVRNEAPPYFIFGFHIKNLTIIEDFLAKRWRVYKDIIYHHRVVKTDTLLQTIIYKLAMQYLDRPDQDHIAVKLLPHDISGLWKALSPQYSDISSADILIQWDDHWLLTILKQAYLSGALQGMEEADCIEEFLTNRKHYYSLIKSPNDFYDINIKTIQALKYLWEDPGIKLLHDLGKKCLDRPYPRCMQCPAIKFFKEFFSFTDILFGMPGTIEDTTFTSEIILWLETVNEDLRKDIAARITGEILQNPRYSQMNNIGHVMVEYRKPKFGIGDVYFYRQAFSTEDYATIELGNISRIIDILRTESKSLVPFYIFLKRSDINKEIVIDDNLKTQIGSTIAQQVFETVLNISAFECIGAKEP